MVLGRIAFGEVGLVFYYSVIVFIYFGVLVVTFMFFRLGFGLVSL